MFSYRLRQSSYGQRSIRRLLRPLRLEQEGHVGGPQGLPGGQGEAGGHRGQEAGKVQKSSA